MKLNKNSEFSIKLMVLIVLIAFLVFDFMLQVYSPKMNMRAIPTLQRLNIYYAFFTTQSNYIVVIYLFFTLFTKQNYNRKPPFGIELAVTVYITVTMLVFWFGLLGSTDEMNSYGIANWISTVVLHLCIPTIMISNFILTSGDYYYSPREHTKFGLFGTTLYPLGYGIFVMIRGKFRYQEFGPDFFKTIYHLDGTNWVANWPEGMGHGTFANASPYTTQMWYPYWFLNFRHITLEDAAGNVWYETPQPAWMLILTLFLASVAIFGLVIGLQFIYLNWNNSKFFRWHDINENLISKEEHDYRKKMRKLKKVQRRNEIKLQFVKRQTERKSWRKSLATLTKEEKSLAISKRKNEQILKTKLEIAEKKNLRLVAKQERRDYRSLMNSLKTQDRVFVRNNLREADRYKRLVSKGVLVSKNKFD
ncbi:hypothetical protein SCHIN_v1c10540 [Spiroplasma chinense]|uniref:Uncharacterized protein n=1 Tax=Spiroplasma chinense TaxID=216932 RepID=A0A5B9Y7F1_9MOLU|nr:Pr6Pr family membrane protein [Spiroplasma chinense]QEH62247.1 hypothetical protein SCHIN_v1c10540 [Spiroplasma chinense]